MKACSRCGGQGWTWGNGSLETCTRCGGIGLEDAALADATEKASTWPSWIEVGILIGLIALAVWIALEGST